jgi:uncharacterized membrane protein YdjX (TVP38/TMEM64 family)
LEGSDRLQQEILSIGSNLSRRKRKKLLAFGAAPAYNLFPVLEEIGELVNRELKRNNSVNNHINSQKPEQIKTVHIWLRLLILVLIVGGLTVILYETGVIQFFLNKTRMASFLNSLGGPWSAGVFVLLQVVQVVAAPIPGEVTGFLGGYVFGKFFGVVLSTIGLTLGSYVAFILARTFGRPLIEKFIPKGTMQRFDYILHHKAAFLVFLLFLIPGFPKDWLCYILGLGHLSTTEFLVIGGTGRLFGTILLTLGGSYLRHNQYVRFWVLVGIGISVVIVALAYRDKLNRIFRFWHLKELRKKRHLEAPQRNTANP